MADQREPAPSQPSHSALDAGLLEAALGWVAEAGELTLEHFRDPELGVDAKGDGTPVTIADRRTEALLRDRIGAACPDDGILGEEEGDTAGSSGLNWVIDPIDGTKAFSHGVATYSNLLALTDGEGPLLGVINLPALRETLWAVRGEGCWFNGRRLDLAAARMDGPAADDRSTGTLEGKVLCVSGFHDWTPELHGRASDAGVLVRTWGDAYGYALVASGRADAMFDPQLEWWDLAAPSLVVREAGGVVTTRSGSRQLRVDPSEGAYAHSAIASGDGAHDLWIELFS